MSHRSSRYLFNGKEGKKCTQCVHKKQVGRLVAAVNYAMSESRKIGFAGKAPHSLNTKEQSRLTL